MERRRNSRSSRSSNTNSDISSAVASNHHNTPTEEYLEHQAQHREMMTRHLAKTAAIEAAAYAAEKSAFKEQQKKKDINYIRSGKASPQQVEKFKSVYYDDIREEVESAKPAANDAVAEVVKRKSPVTPRPTATTPIAIPEPTKANKYYLGGRTKRRSTKGKKTRRGKRGRKSKKAIRKSKRKTRKHKRK
mgnify:CR=1 FL=1